MKPNTIPVTCGIALGLMCAAVASHWMSVRQLVTLAETTARSLNTFAAQNAIAVGAPAGETHVAVAPAPASQAAKPSAPHAATSHNAPTPSPDQDKIDKLLRIVENLAHQNQDLREQVGETNRDLMELQFRVDTHSESFRPLRTTQNPETAYDQSPGVLPPRQQP